MERENLDSVLRNAKRLCDTQTSVIYETVDGRIYKHFKSIALMLDRSAGMRIAEKIDYADKIVDFDELYKPTSAVYSNGHFCGFTSKKNNGTNFNDYDKNVTKTQVNNLYYYLNFFEKLTKLVKKANKHKIVLPDLCSCDNIYIDSEGNLSLIDYDGMQVDEFPVYAMSTSLGDEEKYFVPKYFDVNKRLFTTELDKTSLLLLYFLCTLHVNVAASFDVYKDLSINVLLSEVGLDDPIIRRMVIDTLSSDTKGHYVDVIAGMIADKYITKPHPVVNGSKLLTPR